MSKEQLIRDCILLCNSGDIFVSRLTLFVVYSHPLTMKIIKRERNHNKLMEDQQVVMLKLREKISVVQYQADNNFAGRP